MKNKNSKLIFVLVLLVCLVVPFSVDIFIAGLPEMRHDFNGANVSLVLSVALLGIAIAQPFYGPLLDRFGRRSVLLAGLWLYTLASVVVMLSNSFPLLLVSRFLQALGACSGIISVLVIVRDVYKQDEIIKATGIVMAMIGVSPALAPLIGSILNTIWGWRASFVFLFVIGVFFVIVVQCFFKETQQQKNTHALVWKHIVNNYLVLANNRQFLSYCILSGLSYSILFSYFAISPFFIIKQLHFGLTAFGLIVATNALAIFGMAIITPRFAKRLTLPLTILLGFSLIMLGGVIMWFNNSYFVNSIYSFMLPMFIITIGIGIIRPTASGGAMSLAPHAIAGSASAFFSFLAYSCGAIASSFTSHFISSIAGFGLFIAIIGIVAVGYQSILLNKHNN